MICFDVISFAENVQSHAFISAVSLVHSRVVSSIFKLKVACMSIFLKCERWLTAFPMPVDESSFLLLQYSNSKKQQIIYLIKLHPEDIKALKNNNKLYS